MWRKCVSALRRTPHHVHPSRVVPASFAWGEKKEERANSEHRVGALKRNYYPLLPEPPQTSVVVQDLHDNIHSSTVGSSGLALNAEKSAAPERASLTGKQLWVASKLARENKNIRRTQRVCVVGGEESIRRVWHDYRIRPHVVYVPNMPLEASEEKEWEEIHCVPSWCWESEGLPTYIVRCPPLEIKRQLLSAELSTPYAAEFPWDPSMLLPLSHAMKHPVSEDEMGEMLPSHRSKSITSMLVLVGLRIPSNVGILVRAAEAMGFSSVALVHCADPFQEKVLRASEGTVFSPKLQLYEYEDSKASVVSLLSTLAAQHHLLPLLAVPSQKQEQAVSVAKRFHTHNSHARAGSDHSSPMGPMLILGGESHGLRVLAEEEWSVPFKSLTLPVPNCTIDSLNVGVAGSILMDLFRPSAETHFSQITKVTGESMKPLLDKS